MLGRSPPRLPGNHVTRVNHSNGNNTSMLICPRGRSFSTASGVIFLPEGDPRGATDAAMPPFSALEALRAAQKRIADSSCIGARNLLYSARVGRGRSRFQQAWKTWWKIPRGELPRVCMGIWGGGAPAGFSTAAEIAVIHRPSHYSLAGP